MDRLHRQRIDRIPLPLERGRLFETISTFATPAALLTGISVFVFVASTVSLLVATATRPEGVLHAAGSGWLVPLLGSALSAAIAVRTTDRPGRPFVREWPVVLFVLNAAFLLWTLGSTGVASRIAGLAGLFSAIALAPRMLPLSPNSRMLVWIAPIALCVSILGLISATFDAHRLPQSERISKPIDPRKTGHEVASAGQDPQHSSATPGAAENDGIQAAQRSTNQPESMPSAAKTAPEFRAPARNPPGTPLENSCNPSLPYVFLIPGGGTLELDQCEPSAAGVTDVSTTRLDAPEPSPALIRAIQTALTAHGYRPGGVDGVAGPGTGAAIKRFRTEFDLGSDSVIDFPLLDRLSSSFVRAIQEALLRNGYRPGSIDGRFGKNTRTAIDAFRRANRMPTDGKVIDDGLLEKLGVNAPK